MTPPERWLILTARPSVALDDEVSARVGEILMEAGGRAVLEEGGTLVTHVPEPPDPEALAGRLRSELEPLGLELDTGWQAQEDWAEVWKRGLEPRRVGRALVVSPTWHDPAVQEGDHLIVLDPGMAFGNAEHGTTRGCLRLLEDHLRPGDSVLDVGAGSGILSIAAALLGAQAVLALEADAWAIPTAQENVERNGVADRVEVREAQVDADDLASMEPRQGVIANIEAGILRDLLPGLAGAVAPRGWLLLSGILDHEWEGMASSAEGRGFRVVAVDADGEWRSGLLRRP